ncbi:MAG: GNAT family N-acetyltransferase [Acidimicrobiales bacterium]
MHAAREATPGDLPVIASLFEAARFELSTARGGDLLLAREMATLDPAALLDDPSAFVVVGTYDGVVVGIATARLETLADGTCLAVIGSLYVDREAREVGVGEAMLDEIFPWAKEHGCRGIDALVLPGMRESKNFFEMFGLVARAIVVHRPL